MRRSILIITLLVLLNVLSVYASESSPNVNVYVDMDSVVDELVVLQEQIGEIQTEIDDNEQYVISVSRYMILTFFVLSIASGYYIGYSLGNNKIGR